MSQISISIGSSPNSGTGIPIRTAISDINANFTDLYQGTGFTFTGDATNNGLSITVKAVNGVVFSGLATGILKNTTSSGVPSIAVAGDFPILNQNTTGTAANITGTYAGTISSSQVTTALGFTPLSTVTSGQITSALGFTPIAANQTITLSGDVAGTGSTSIASTIQVGAVTDAKASLSNKPTVGLVADATTGNITLSGAQTIDGVLGTAGMTYVLLTAQTTTSQNGPWLMQTGAWTRPAWYPSGGTTQAFQFAATRVRLGTVYANSLWDITSTGAVTIDTTATTWTIKPTAINSNTAILGASGTSLTFTGAIPVWVHVGSALSYTAFSTAATTNSIALFTLPIAGVIHAVKIKHSTAFAGTSVTGLTLSVGISGTVDKYASAFSVFSATSGTNFQLSQSFGSENHTATTPITITATSTGANLSALTAGAVDVWALLSTAI
jgi:hypothetical protein